MTDEQFAEIVERLDRIEAALESLLGIAEAGSERGVPPEGRRPGAVPPAPPSRGEPAGGGGEPADLDTAELMKHQVSGWD